MQPAITVCAPITQLWATWIWLSSFTPSSITVSSSAPRSMVVLAPISTSSPMRTRADLRDLDPAPAVARHAETVGADHRARVQDRSARRSCSRRRSVTRAMQHAFRRRSPTSLADDCNAAPMHGALADRASARRSTANGADLGARGRRCAPASTSAEGCTPGVTARCGMEERDGARVVGVRIVGDDARASLAASRSPGPTITAPARVAASARAVLRIGEEGDARRARPNRAWPRR